jgi:hypothetical protein
MFWLGLIIGIVVGAVGIVVAVGRVFKVPPFFNY